MGKHIILFYIIHSVHLHSISNDYLMLHVINSDLNPCFVPIPLIPSLNFE